MPRIIAHFDMDAFFAAIEEREHPRLRGKPIVVGADPEGGKGRGVVATANYAARKYGIRSAMPIGEAWRRAKEGERRGGPEVVFMAGDHGLYGEVSARIMTLIRKEAPIVEQASVDEAYIDLSSAGSFDAAADIALRIKEAIFGKERLTASVGIGPNKLIAKIASDREKPDGCTVVPLDLVQDLLDPLAVRALPGIGPKAEADLLRRGIRTIKDLRSYSEEQLTALFGAWGGDMYKKARGEDASPVAEGEEARSIGSQETFAKDTLDPVELALAVRTLAHGVGEAFRKSGFASFRTVILTVRFADFKTVSRRRTLGTPVTAAAGLAFEAMRLLLPFLDARENPHKKRIRLLGIRIEKLE